MIVSYEEAINIFEKLPNDSKTYYHHPEYVINDSLNKKQTSPLFYAFEMNDEIFYHAFHFGEIESSDFNDIQSPYGYGGPILNGSPNFLKYATNKYKKWCQENNVLLEFMRFHPSSKNYLVYYGSTSKNRETVSIDLESEDLLSSFSPRTRTSIRKAIKGNINIVFSKEEKYISGFIQLYNQLMNFKGAESEYFFEEEYFRELMNSEKVRIGISQETLMTLKNRLEYKKIDNKHYLETYNDLIPRLLRENKEN